MVVLLAHDAAVDISLLLGFEHLGAGEEATGRDVVPGRDKGPVVGAAAEGGRLGRQSPRIEVIDEQLLDDVGARRPESRTPGLADWASLCQHPSLFR